MNKISYSNQSGGVAFCIKDRHTSEIVEDVFFGQDDVDDLWIKFKLGSNKSMKFGNLYRHTALNLLCLSKLLKSVGFFK